MISLRPHQVEAETNLRRAYRGGARAVLMTMPCGAGKTTSFISVARQAAERGRKTLVLVHRQELLMQASRRMDAMGVEHGLIARGVTPSHEKIQVASVQTLIRRLDRMDYSPDLLVVDEAHHAVPGNMWGKVLSHYGNAKILGCTATPERLDGKGLGVEAGGFFDSMVLGPSAKELIAQGYLSQPVVYAPSVVDTSSIHITRGDYVASELEELMSNPRITGDAINHYRKIAHQQPAIVFSPSVRHAEIMADLFQRAGYRAASIDGTLDDKTRKDRIADLGNGALHVLTSCEIVSEGTDIPVVSVGILLRPTKSLGMFIQQTGRVMRPAPGKTRALILDHVGNVLMHGMPDEDREWSLAGKKKKGRDEKSENPVRQCENCFRVHKPAPACPYCGYIYPKNERPEIEQVDGELEVINPEILNQLRHRDGDESVKKNRRLEVQRARTLPELQQLGMERGYKNPRGWAYHVMQARSRGDHYVE